MGQSPPFGAELRRIRNERGISLAGLSKLTHYSKGYLSKIETGAKPAATDLARRLDEALGASGRLVELAEAAQRPECPYLGLASFDSGDAAWFFGRERATRELLDGVAGALEHRKPVAVVGPSGVGKSSLVRAGLLPALARDALPGSAGWPVLVMTPTAAPGAEFERRSNSLGGPDASPKVVFVDQFEELFTLCQDDAERQAFITMLADLADTGVLVVFCLRADFYGRCLSHPGLLEVLRHHQITVGPMTVAELRATITGPAEMAGLTLEAGLVELLVADVGTNAAGSLPLLSHALLATWEEREGTTLTVAGYRRTGGIGDAVASTAEKAYETLDPREREAARRLLLRLVRVGEHEQDTRRPADRERLLAQSAEETWAALQELAAARLLTVDADTVTIAHEALLHAWPRLRHWIESDRAGLRVQHQLIEAAGIWDTEQRHPSLLYRGPRLTLASDWARDHDDQLGTLERDFLTASRELEDATLAKERRHTRRLRLLVTGLAVLTVLAAVAGVLAVIQRDIADHHRDIAVSRELATEANQLRQTDPSLATQLSLAAYRVADTPQARGSLLSASGSTYVTRTKPHPGSITDLVFTADGHTLITAGLDGATRFFDVSGSGEPVPRAVLKATAEWVTALAISPANGLLATADGVDETRLWSTASTEHPVLLGTVPGTGQGNALALSADGTLLAIGREDGGIGLWNVADPARPVDLGILRTHAKAVRSLAFAPAGRLLVTGSDDFTSQLWDLSGPPVQVATLTTHIATIRALAFSPDGATLGTGSDDRTVHLWTVTDPRQPVRKATLTGHDNAIRGLSFHPDGTTVATASDDQTVRTWNAADASQLTSMAQPAPARRAGFGAGGRLLATGNDLGGLWLWHLPSPVVPNTAGTTTVAHDPHRPQIAVGGEDGRVRLWSTADQRPMGVLADDLPGKIRVVAYDPRGRVLAVAGDDRVTRLWDVADPAHPRPIAPLGEVATVYAAVFRSDGRVLALAGRDRNVTLWDTSDPARPVRLSVLTGHENAISGLAFSPDGRLLATGSDDYTGRIWDVSDPGAPGFRARLTDHSNAVTGVAFSPDGKTIATSSEDHTVHLLDIGDPRVPVLAGELTGHADSVTVVTFSPDGRLVATAADDQTSRVWDVSNRAKAQALAVLTGHTAPVNAVVFSPDGRRLITTGDDRTTRLWSTNADDVAQRICTQASPPLSPEQWSQYVADMPHPRLCP
ncbi:helix-turn-helix domain-containing protein [Amycolatopsis anabasis]|uniref:nSTAND1 domain-containing NTPase n=1 Tax=Amycolatopsis anabasis TaxID=1840409 RepID=UPI00131D4AA5|nr:helix-turn-helix domain-containing protein [Amycolatopsis anabasis]